MGNDTLKDLLQRIEALGRENAILREQKERAHPECVPSASDQTYRQLFETNAVVKLLIDPQTGAIFDANKAAVAFYGYPLETFKRLHLADIDISAKTLATADAEHGPETNRRQRSRHRLASGEIRDVEVISSTVIVDRHLLLYDVVEDVTEHLRTERVLRRSERSFRQLVENTADPIFRIDIRGYFEYANPAALRLFGYHREELHSLYFTDLVRPDHRQAVHTFYVAQALQQVLNTYYEFPAITKDGREIWIGQNVQILREGRRIVGYQGVARDISERKRAEAPQAAHIAHLHRRNRRLLQRLTRLEHTNVALGDLALTDYLTGLHNHRAFQEQLEQTFVHACTTETPLSLILIDLDGFKQVNDTRGHPAGDCILETVGALLRDKVRATDVVARYGGEEFAIVLPFTDQAGAMAQAERFRLQIEMALSEDGITASFGVASLTSDTLDRQQLIRQADAALYAAKRAGRNCVRHYTQLAPDVRASVFAIVAQHPAAEGPTS